MRSPVCHRRKRMRIVISEFISLDGVVQAPGGAEEDTDGGFRHGGWSMPFFDPEIMGGFIGGGVGDTHALLPGGRGWEGEGGGWAGGTRGGHPVPRLREGGAEEGRLHP